MNYRKIIAESWQYTQQHKGMIRWLGFVPAVFTTGSAIIILVYQFYSFRASGVFGNEKEDFLQGLIGQLVEFLKEYRGVFWPLLITSIFVLIGYLFLPTLCKAAAIKKISSDRKGKPMRVLTSLKHGYLTFLPLLEYHLLIKTFSFFTLMLESAFVLRNFGWNAFFFWLPILIIMVVAGLVMTLMFTYADFFIVVDREPIFRAMKKSGRMVILNWRHTFLVTILMIIIGIRIIFQAVLVFMIPALVVMIAGYLATIIAPVAALTVGIVLGLAALITASYLNGVVDVFSYAVWTFTFLDLKKRAKNEEK